jgi:hypothetical protein
MQIIGKQRDILNATQCPHLDEVEVFEGLGDEERLHLVDPDRSDLIHVRKAGVTHLLM